MGQDPQLVWLFGRGASVACGLHWTVPEEHLPLERTERVRLIREQLLAELDDPKVNTSPYRRLLAELAERTCPGEHHLFLTTNWDTSLEREINSLLPEGGYTRAWLPNTFVFHLNGTVEAENERRSPMLLETDAPAARTQSLEFDMAVSEVVWCQRFVVVGISFACPTDQTFLKFLHSVREEVPVGSSQSQWVVVNQDQPAAHAVGQRIKAAIPGSEVRCVVASFENWIHSGLVELVDAGVLRR